MFQFRQFPFQLQDCIQRCRVYSASHSISPRSTYCHAPGAFRRSHLHRVMSHGHSPPCASRDTGLTQSEFRGTFNFVTFSTKNGLQYCKAYPFLCKSILTFTYTIFQLFPFIVIYLPSFSRSISAIVRRALCEPLSIYIKPSFLIH